MCSGQDLVALKAQMVGVAQASHQLELCCHELFTDCGSDEQAAPIKKRMEQAKSTLAAHLAAAQQIVSGM